MPGGSQGPFHQLDFNAIGVAWRPQACAATQQPPAPWLSFHFPGGWCKWHDLQIWQSLNKLHDKGAMLFKLIYLDTFIRIPENFDLLL
jgi:hypothetical protein